VLFNNSIFYNIQYGRPGRQPRRGAGCCGSRSAYTRFIEQLPDGYETRVGERGLKLSGGEKQRVAIARALLKNPPLLIFDEATSALDSKTEKAIQGSLDNAARGRTTLVIAHRLSTIMNADQILVMDAGRIVERGSHQQLLAGRRGLYAQMWLNCSSRRRRRQALHSTLSSRPAAAPADEKPPTSRTKKTRPGLVLLFLSASALTPACEPRPLLGSDRSRLAFGPVEQFDQTPSAHYLHHGNHTSESEDSRHYEPHNAVQFHQTVLRPSRDRASGQTPNGD
jgi:ABC-type glutathione transport system ATPase component